MDKQWSLGVYKKDRDILETQLNTVLALVKSGGTTAALLNTLQAKLDVVIALLKASGTTAVLLDNLQTKVDAVLVAVEANRTQDDLYSRLLLNRPLGNAGLVEGTNAATIKLTTTIAYINQGLFKSKTAADNIAVTAGAAQAAETFVKYLVTLQADGTVVTTKGADAASAGAALLPAVPANETPVGYFQIETNAGQTWTAGTDDIGDGAKVASSSFVDLAWPNSGTNAIVALGATGVSALGALVHPTTALVGTLTHPTTATVSGLQKNP